MKLFVDGGKKIVDEKGAEWSEADAKRAWESGQVEDYNLSFKRLTTCGFSLEKLKAFYREDEAKRKTRLPK
jgi:hypothetical protein